MTAIALALAASAAWGLADFLGGLASRSNAVLRVLAISQPAGLLLLALIALYWGHGIALSGSLAWSAAAGLASLGSLACLYLAMARGSMILVAPLAATGVIIPVIVGLAEGNSVTWASGSGMALATTGTIAATWNPADADAGAPRSGNLVAALFALGSAAGQGLFLLTLHYAASGDPYSATFAMRVFSCFVALVVFSSASARTRRRSRDPASGARARTDDHLAIAGPGPAVPAAPDMPQHRLTSVARAQNQVAEPACTVELRRQRWSLMWLLPAAAGLADATAEVCFAAAGSSGELSVVAVLSSLYPIGTMLLALLILRERVRHVQGIGAVCALAGVLLLSLT